LLNRDSSNVIQYPTELPKVTVDGLVASDSLFSNNPKIAQLDRQKEAFEAQSLLIEKGTATIKRAKETHCKDIKQIKSEEQKILQLKSQKREIEEKLASEEEKGKKLNKQIMENTDKENEHKQKMAHQKQKIGKLEAELSLAKSQLSKIQNTIEGH